MKKLILLLALALGVEVKGQIVGGFVPINSTKSFTAGNSTFSNVIARGTLSVGSTATVTGALKASSTFSLGSANLTGGNTGTVAVLSDAVFALNLGGGLVSTPADGSTYYYGNISGVFTQQGFGKIYIPYNITLVGWTYNAWVTSVASSSESSTLSINIDNSATNLSTSITFSAASGVNTYSNSGLSINVNSGSYIEAKLINPTWSTNPQGVNSAITFWFVRRS